MNKSAYIAFAAATLLCFVLGVGGCISNDTTNDTAKFESLMSEGDAWTNARDYKKAFSAYNLAVKRLEAKNARAYYSRGNAYLALGMYQGAIADYDMCLRAAPRHGQCHYNRAEALYEMGSYEDAANSYAKAFGLMPDYTQALYNEGAALRKLGRKSEAEQLMNMARELDPSVRDKE